VFAAIKEKLL